MKQWEVTFVDQNGVPTRLPILSEHCPSDEEAARLIRAHLFPVIDKVDLNDFQGRASSPTAKWLEEQNGVKITAITPLA
ncbi:hypothetical protein [Pseudomonas typographi]|uniref:Uncharacterized protein n=1 Tax=Pseudomonas typographi TaxID=2715964 RepID=A0ABR7YZX2_9PSED|nr:hypothetical protein [Pseudomonas typographi]MBD1550602.1 hypothetical protein [Pseudomonas typographi]MBD1586813.1 hypothetical protein [Pseudomonas typographi]MBD1598707.1 hypothetical protein [Pseudomonas typographi]